MTREGFIRKWLANPQKHYDEHCRDEMREDLDKVIEYAQQPAVMPRFKKGGITYGNKASF